VSESPIVLFLDDMQARHDAFSKAVLHRNWRIVHAHTAATAIKYLRDHPGEVAIAFLDHDLSEQDIMVAVGEPSHVPTGMHVVTAIVEMPPEARPTSVVVHSCNEPAAREMQARLEDAGVQVRRMAFPQLARALGNMGPPPGVDAA
jgi:ActR/RegA family two-component response regulator